MIKPSKRGVAELLSTQTRFVHQTAFRYGKGRHALAVLADGRRVVLTTAGAGRRACGGGCGRGARNDGDGGRLASAWSSCSIGPVRVGDTVTVGDLRGRSRASGSAPPASSTGAERR